MLYDQPRKLPNNIYTHSAEGDSDEDTPKCYQVSNSSTPSKSSSTTTPIRQPSGGGAGAAVETKLSSSIEFTEEDEHVYEMEPTPVYEDTDVVENALPVAIDEDDGSIYENTEFSPFDRQESLIRKHSSPAVLQDVEAISAAAAATHVMAARAQSMSSAPSTNRKGKRHTPDDYEDPDAVLDFLEDDDYMDMQVGEGHNMYIDPEDLKRGSPCSSVATASSGSFTSTKRTESSSSVPGPNSKISFL